MAEITRPDPSVTQANLANMTVVNVSGALNEGQAAINAGTNLQNQAMQFAKEANAAFNESIYTRAYSDAVLEFSNQYEQRSRQTTDQNGNPTFGTLPQDTHALAKKTADRYSSSILDIPTRQKFLDSFMAFSANKQLQAQATARTQQVQFSQAALTDSVTKLTQQALIQDPATANSLIGDINASIASALSQGLITPMQAQQMRDTSRSSIRTGIMQKAIAEHPMEMVKVLRDTDPRELDLTVDERDRLIDYANAVINDQAAQASKQRKEQIAIQKEMQNLNTLELQERIGQDQAGLPEIEQALHDGSISAEQRYSLRSKYFAKQDSDGKSAEANNIINQAIADGRAITGVSTKQISDNFNQRVALQSRDPNTGQPRQLSVMQKAQLASQYNAAVKPIQDELGGKALNGNTQEAGDAIQGYMYLSQNNPRALDGMNREEEAILSTAAGMMNSTNLSLEDAVKYARERVLNISDDEKSIRMAKYNKVDDFKPENIKETIREMYDVDSFFGLGGADINQDTIQAVRNRLQDAYMLTGNRKDAENLVKRWTTSVMGETQFAGPETTFTFMPPEKVYGEHMAGMMRRDLDNSLARLGIDAEGVTLVYDSASKSPSWLVMKTDEFGMVHNVYGATGKPERWAFDPDSVLPEMQAEQIQAATENAAKQEEAIKIGQKTDRESRMTIYEQIRTYGDRAMPLGDISKKYESGNTGAGTISSGNGDPGGKSYGSHQLAKNTGTLQEYVSQSQFKEELSKYPLASPQFDKVWKELASEFPKEFEEDQRSFITQNNYAPVRAVADEVGLPDTEAVNEALYSMGVQHGRASSIVRKAAESLPEDASESEIVKALYKFRESYVKGLSSLSSRLKKSLLNRYGRELKDVLGMIGE